MSNLFRLGWRDLFKGIVVSVLSAVVGYLGNLTTLTDLDWKQVLQLAVVAGLGYLAKNLVSDNNDKVLGKF